MLHPESCATDSSRIPDDFYEKLKPRLRRRIGREIRLARRVIDMGCGGCDLVRYLTDRYHQQVTGIDLSTSRFPTRRRTPSGHCFHCLAHDAAHLTFAKDESVDAVIGVWVLHELSDPVDTLQEAWRVLRPGGELLLVDFPSGSLAQRLWDEAFWLPAAVREMMLTTGFQTVRVRLIEQDQVIWARGFRPPIRRQP